MKPNWGGAGTGALSGAALGSAVLPGWGTAIGAGLGGLAGFFGMMNSGKGKFKSRLSPEQEQAMQSYFNNPINNDPNYAAGSGYLQNILSGDPEAFKAFEAPYMQNFQQNIVPGIAERFAGAGTGPGAMSSSGLNNSLAQAGRNLQTDLAGMRGNLQMQASQMALPYAQQPYSNLMSGLNFSPYAYQQGQEGMGNVAAQSLPYLLMMMQQRYGQQGGNGAGGTV